MEKKELIRDENRIGQTVAALTNLAETIERNFEVLEKYNEISKVLDLKYIYEITTYKHEKSKDEIQKYLRNNNLLDVNYDNIFNRLIDILFFEKRNKTNIKNYPDVFLHLLPLEHYIVGYYDSEFENKESFSIDYINKKVSIKNEVIERINEKHTIYITSKNQIKALESINIINNEIGKLLKMYDDRGDNITNDLYRNITNCFTSNNYMQAKTLNYYNVYNYILSNIKE